MQVAIIGGGIAGLAAGAAFARRGHAVAIHEQAAEIAEIGAGLQITPNGAAVLAGLGLGPEADRRGIRAQAVEPMDGLSGRRIARFDLTGLPGHPYRFFHRADLIEMLAQAATGAGAQIRTAARITDPATLTADLVIGADGLHSVLRPRLNPESAPFFTGQLAWRAIVAGEHPPAARIWMLPGRHAVTYPLPGGRINLVAVRETPEWRAEGWRQKDDPANLVAAFAGAAPELAAILRRVGDLHLWGLFRHPVAAVWQDGRHALIGDAAHPTLPFLAQGANLALEDAWTLAATPDRAAWAAARRPRVSRAIAAANANARNYHLSGLPRRIAHLGLGALGRVAPGAFLSRLAWLYDHDVTR